MCNYNSTDDKDQSSKITFVNKNAKPKETPANDKNTNNDPKVKCEEKCKPVLSLSDTEATATYGGKNKQEAYENCMAKCLNQDVPHKEKVTKYPTKCSTKLNPTSKIFDIDGPINVGVTLVPNREGLVIRSMRGVILETSKLA